MHKITRESKQVWRVIDILKWGEKYFAERAFENARREIELLVQEVLNCKRVDLYLRYDEPLTKAQLSTLRDWIQRRIKHEPVQYITGRVGFHNILLNIVPGVLIPRPESEMLVETALRLVSKNPNASILDIGTGSGCIALALAKALPEAQIIGIDNSGQAVELSNLNAGKLQIANAEFQTFDILKDVMDKKFDIIVSNPPYIPKSDMDELMPEVRDFEPHSALTDFDDGLTFYRKFVEISKQMLKPNGWFVLEVGLGNHPELVNNLFVKNHFKEVELIKDYNGDWRVLIARMK